MGELQAKIPTEVLVTDRREFELAEEGFITLTMRKGSDNAAFSLRTQFRNLKLSQILMKVKLPKPIINWELSFLTCSLSTA